MVHDLCICMLAGDNTVLLSMKKIGSNVPSDGHAYLNIITFAVLRIYLLAGDAPRGGGG